MRAPGDADSTCFCLGQQGLVPERARLEAGAAGGWREVPTEALAAGDILTVLPGDRVPVDGVVVSGASSANEAALTGEPLPVYKGPGAVPALMAIHSAAQSPSPGHRAPGGSDAAGAGRGYPPPTAAIATRVSHEVDVPNANQRAPRRCCGSALRGMLCLREQAAR